MTVDLAKVVTKTETEEASSDLIERGQWYWVKDEEDGPWLACVTYVGTNYAQLDSANTGSYCRVHFDKFDEEIERRELDPDAIIEKNVNRHREAVNLLLDEIKQLTAKLGLTPVGELTEHGERENALVVVHGTKDVKAHKKALIKAKEKTLPDLFRRVTDEHKEMANWMKAQLVPMEAEAENLKKSTKVIKDRIFTVELYAGLCEDLVQIRDGEPAGNDEKVHLFQRRHYMDEECLLDYKAGGMDFKGIHEFDRWLMKKANRERILPFPKCVVAFQVRRKTKDREVSRLTDFITFRELENADRLTFLYIRNGERYYWMSTEIEFGKRLFPKKSGHRFMTGQIYIKEDFGTEIITEKEYLESKAEEAERKKKYEKDLAAWKKLSKAKQKDTWEPSYHEPFDRYEPLSPASVYYDDGMRKIANVAKDHNRIAIVMQGLLDRSKAFHPHPPWRLWTPEGFAAGIELIYDDSHSLTDGDPPDFEAYRDRLNASITKGTHVVGQQRVWERAEAKKENERMERDWRLRDPLHRTYFSPYGNDGPGNVAEVVGMTRDKKGCKFIWKRERLRQGWVDDPDRPGWDMRDQSGVTTHFKCSTKLLLNVDAYKPGDYKQFYADPRTRADYLKWAPLLLEAENFHGRRDKK